MAKGKGVRVKMECQVCKHINYTPRKTVGLKNRLLLSKNCKFCKKHTEHKETK